MQSESDVMGNVSDLCFPYDHWSMWFLWDHVMMSFESKSYGSHHVIRLSTLVSLVMYCLPMEVHL